MNRNKNATNDNNNKGGSKPTNKNRNGKGRNKNGNKPKPNFDYDKEKEYFQKKTGNPASLYFTDERLAQQNSYVSNRTVLDTAKDIRGTGLVYPNIIAYHMNPSPSVTVLEPNGLVQIDSSVSISAQKLLTMIIANTGRVQSYGKLDIIMLILAIGEYVSMTEYGRRVFGAFFRYDELNRDIPKQFITGMGIDYDDFVVYHDNYLSQFNWYINLGSQIVIPMDKIPYLRKCRDIYQKIYEDGTDELTCYHMFVPDSTWIIDETSSTLGTMMKTVNVTGMDDMKYVIQSNSSSHANEAITQPHTIRTFQDWLDKVYKPIVNALLSSSTINDIYSDLRNAKFQKAYPFEFWKAELVDDSYKVPVEYDETMLDIFHNMNTIGKPFNGRMELDPNGVPLVTTTNDVYADPNKDAIVYNPCIHQGTVGASTETWSADSATDPANAYVWDSLDPIFDFKSFDPSLDQRVDTMAYRSLAEWRNDYSVFGNFCHFLGSINYSLPDHYCTGRYVFMQQLVDLGVASGGSTGVYDPVYNNGWLPLGRDNRVMGIGEVALSGSQTFRVHDLQFVGGVLTDVWTTTLGTWDYRSVNHNVVMFVSWINGIAIGYDPYTYQVESNFNIQRIAQGNVKNGDLDNFYVLPRIKLLNMRDHAYQTLFTADGIM